MAKKNKQDNIMNKFTEEIRKLFNKKLKEKIIETHNRKDPKIRRNFSMQNEAEMQEILLDPVLLRCIELSITATTKHDYYILAKDDRVKAKIESFVNYNLGFKEYSADVLNALLGINNNIAVLTGLKAEPLLILQQDKSDLAFREDTAKRLNELGREYDKINYYNATNIFSTILGLSPLEFVKEELKEKLYLKKFNQAYAKANGKLNQIITFNKDFAAAYLGNSDPSIRMEMTKIIEELTNGTIDELENLIVPIPLDIVNFQDSNRDMQFIERIRQINYSICSAFGVPPSLVGFDETTDPNLANGENQKDTFISISIDKYKTLIEKIFTDIISQTLGISEKVFKFKVGREINDEALERSNQLIRAVEKIGGILQQLGYDIELDQELFKNIGITITKRGTALPINETPVNTPANRLNPTNNN